MIERHADEMIEPQDRERAHPLRVCFYTFFPGGGIGRYTHELATAMNTLPDVDVEVAGSADYEWRDADGYRVWAKLHSLYHRIPTVRRARFLQRQFANPLRFIDHAKRVRADVVHLSNINHISFPIWRRAFRRSGIPVAATVHDVQRQKSIINAGWEDRQLKSFYRFAQALFVHSEYQAGELMAWAGVDRSRVHVVPHGVYPHGSARRAPEIVRAELELPQEAVVALFFGQIRDEKNLDGLIEALRYSGSSVYLVVAGQANARHRQVEYYQQLVRKWQLGNRVRFIARHIEDHEVGELFGASDFIALPYRKTFTSQSGVLNVAVNYDKPVVVSTAPVLSETVRESGVGVACEGDDPRSLARGIERVSCGSTAEYEHAFARYRQNYSWAENSRRTVQVYDALLSSISTVVK